MATLHESADLLLKLYDLRRETRMREARQWMMQRFDPETFQELAAVLEGPRADSFRMVATYWDMAAALVNHGAIDEALFTDVTAEHIRIFAKIEPFLAELRLELGNPAFLAHLERLVTRLPNASSRLEELRERSRAAAAKPETASP